MVFSSIMFMFIYLPVVLAVYYIVPLKWRNVWLFAVNLAFYGWAEPVYIILMLFSITINYVSGIFIGRYREDNRKKAKNVLVLNIIVNLGALFVFKYTNLFIDTFNSIAGQSIISPLALSLPLGISFYTFQTISYAVDVYRGDAAVQRNFMAFGNFVTLFPKLIQGPIVRYKDIAGQLVKREHSVEKFASGVRRFAVGLAKKLLIANNVAALWDIYSGMGASELTVLGSWLGIIAFTFQIYFDFSGYCDMAIGVGRMIGFELTENFRYPYASRSVTDYWRRWHMTLGAWFRDYVYIPLGGNKRGQMRQYFNIMVVWALTGFWHGANWTFMLWGVYYGVLLIIEKRFLLKKLERAPAAVAHVYVMLATVLGWVVFQIENLSKAAVYYKAMFGFAGGGAAVSADIYYLTSFALVLVVAAVGCTSLPRDLYNKLPRRVQGVVTPVLIVLALGLCMAYMVDASYTPFLYFKF